MADEFHKLTGAPVAWCQACETFNVLCPCCGANACGSGCREGNGDWQRMMDDRLAEALAEAEGHPKYTYSVDIGLSWRDCPYYTVYADGKQVHSGIGREESAEAWIRKAISGR